MSQRYTIPESLQSYIADRSDFKETEQSADLQLRFSIAIRPDPGLPVIEEKLFDVDLHPAPTGLPCREIRLPKSSSMTCRKAGQRVNYVNYINCGLWRNSPARLAELEASDHRCRTCNASLSDVDLQVHYRTYTRLGAIKTFFESEEG